MFAKVKSTAKKAAPYVAVFAGGVFVGLAVATTAIGMQAVAKIAAIRSSVSGGAS